MKSRKCTLHISYRFATKSRSHTRKKPCLLCLGILVAKESVRGFILFDLRKSSDGRIKPVIRIVVIYLGNFTQEHCSRSLFDFEIMIHARLYRDTLTGSESDLCAGLYLICPAICMDSDVAFLIDLFIRQRIIDSDQ